MEDDYEIFKGKSFSDLCRDIVRNSEEKKNQLDILITDLKDMIKTIENAVMVVPLLEKYFDVSVRNDEQLIKLAAIIQRLITGKMTEGDGATLLTEEEKKQLMTAIEETAKAIEKPNLPDSGSAG
jgi:tRNA U34 5-carboxymethylaminomethyl modifying GTPase MnmE/TrmE